MKQIGSWKWHFAKRICATWPTALQSRNMSGTPDGALLNIGVQCSLSTCSIQDFLPIFCYCQNYFCSFHIQPDLHQCPIPKPATDPANLDQQGSSATSPRCSSSECNKKALVTLSAVGSKNADIVASPILCPGCQNSFCIYHNHPASHKCPALLAIRIKSESRESFKVLLAKNNSSTSPSSSSSLSSRVRTRAKPKSKVHSDPVKYAQWKKIELLKMRHRAVSGDPNEKGSPPVDQRIHIEFEHPATGMAQAYWFRKTLIAGRVLDMLAKVSNTPTTPQAVGLYLVLPPANQDSAPASEDGETERDGTRLLKSDEVLSNQVEDGAILTLRLRP